MAMPKESAPARVAPLRGRDTVRNPITDPGPEPHAEVPLRSGSCRLEKNLYIDWEGG